MHFDNPTLFHLLLVQALASAAVMAGLMLGPRISRATRWALVCMGLQAVGWLCFATVTPGGSDERALMSAGLLAFSASLSALWWALRLWLAPRRGLALVLLAPLLMPLVYALQFDDVAFRVGWSHFWLALQLGLLILNLALPTPPGLRHGADSRRWRGLLLLGLLPLLAMGLLRGVAGAFGPPLASPFGDSELNSLLGLSCHLALLLCLLALVLAWRGEIEAELARLAQTDGLTGLADRASFANRARDMISMARRHQEPLALMVLDLDGLKAVNAEQGEQAGDRALALFGSCLQAQMRLGDLAGRVGGEEFGVLMARTEAPGPQALDQRLREMWTARALPELGFTLDFSAGWAKLRPGDRDIEDLMRRAETALYEAKHAGRGRLLAEPGLEG